jgi:hypothetical protein
MTDPSLNVSVTYSVECFKNPTNPKRPKFLDGGFNAAGPSTVRIPLPYKRADKCVVSVGAVLLGVDEGPIRLQLFARHPH